MKLQEITKQSITIERHPNGASPILLICEHASNHFPERFNNLGLTAAERESHIAWDPGALAVAEFMSDALDASLISCAFSRLLYDCNRAPDRIDAIRDESDGVIIPGNRNLTNEQRQQRVRQFYEPFKTTVEKIARRKQIIITIHSFNPVYSGEKRNVEIGLLHDIDARLADAMLGHAKDHTDLIVRRNEPYSATDGVTHTLKAHALKSGKLNVMIEIRNDLIADESTQTAMANMLSGLVTDALHILDVDQKGVSIA